jgi:hypothetical protein
MSAVEATFAYGTLQASTDSWLLAAEHVIPLDLRLVEPFDSSLEREFISVVGRMASAESCAGTKLLVEKLVGHDEIRGRAYDLYVSGQGGDATQHWLRAERELLSR